MSTPRPENGKPEQDDDAKDRGLMPIWRLSSIGIEMGVAVFVGWAIGHFLDGRLGTDPWMMIVFSLLGIAAGFKGMVAAAREARADAKHKADLKARTGGDGSGSDTP